MKLELSIDALTEFACCIVDCDLDRDDACEYIITAALEANGLADDAELTE